MTDDETFILFNLADGKERLAGKPVRHPLATSCQRHSRLD